MIALFARGAHFVHNVPMSARRLTGAALVMLVCVTGVCAPPEAAQGDASSAGVRASPRQVASQPASSAAGESIYLRGVLGSGASLQGIRDNGGMTATGADAACVNCHQRSGLGSKEGNIWIPPITGDYLFASSAHEHPALHYVETMHNRPPYTEATLARAIREGIDSAGRPLGSLMPRFTLDDADMKALAAFLKGMDVHRVPGITASVLHFATIFTPDADPVKRAGVLDVLEHYVAEKNSFPFGPSPRMLTSGKTAYSKSMYMANLRWQLHVWELTGPAATWREQLEKHLKEEPVFAVLSGLGGSNWAPVHDFCERNEIPCLFPNVEVPIESAGDFYSLYFSRGVLLEAELIASRIAGAQPAASPPVVTQVYRSGDSGEAAARTLADQLQRHGIAVHARALAPQAGARALAKAVRTDGQPQILVLWLRPKDIAALGPPPEHATLYVSGLMGGLEDAPLPPSWRASSHMVYPFDLPDRRGVRLDYALGWFTFRHIPVVDMQVQADTYLTCSLLSEVMKHMADTYVRAYLIEQLQGMLEHRIMTGYYPHLALAYHQQFASKGGYIAHFSEASGQRLIADSGWVVP